MEGLDIGDAMRFSQRTGVVAIPETLKPEAMPEDLRNTLWNAAELNVRQSEFGAITHAYWVDFIKKPINTRPFFHNTVKNTWSYQKAWEVFRSDFLQVAWSGVYDRVEFLINLLPRLAEPFDQALARELAAYRIVHKQVVPITSAAEVEALEDALSQRDAYAGVQTHIASALAHLSNRQNPDYRNSIKESISAVEAAAAVIAGKPGATLGAALATLEKERKLHGSLKAAFSSLYGYTSDANGIRHALMDEPDLTAADAKFFLLTCSSFVNYLKSLS